MRRGPWIVIYVSFYLFAGCAKNNEVSREPTPQDSSEVVVVTVRNHNWLDVDIYAGPSTNHPSGFRRLRSGVTSQSTVNISLPQNLRQGEIALIARHSGRVIAGCTISVFRNRKITFTIAEQTQYTTCVPW